MANKPVSSVLLQEQAQEVDWIDILHPGVRAEVGRVQQTGIGEPDDVVEET